MSSISALSDEFTLFVVVGFWSGFSNNPCNLVSSMFLLEAKSLSYPLKLEVTIVKSSKLDVYTLYTVVFRFSAAVKDFSGVVTCDIDIAGGSSNIKSAVFLSNGSTVNAFCHLTLYSPCRFCGMGLPSGSVFASPTI